MASKMNKLPPDLNDVLLNADKALVQLGVWGRYQLLVFILANLPWVFVAFQMMSMAFVGATPPFTCIRSTDVRPLLLNNTWDRVCSVRDHNATIQCGQNNTHFEFEPSFGNTIVSQWQLVCNKDMIAQVATSLFFAGILVGSLFIPSLADRYGRRLMILVFALLMTVFGVASSFASSVPVFFIIRFISGATTAGLSLPSWVLACEVMVPSKRSYGVAAQGIFWGGGYTLTGLIAYLVPDWRAYYLVASLPCLSLIVYYWLIPESLHWYVAQGRNEDAWRWIQRAARFNGVTVELKDCLQDAGKAVEVNKKETLLDLCASSPLLLQSLVMAYLWVSNTFVYYGLSLFTTELAGNRYMNYVLSGIIEIPAYFALNPLLNWFGRKRTIGGFHVIAAFALFSLMFVPSEINGTSLVFVSTTLWLIGKYSIASSFMGVWLYGAEIFPTTVRTTGLGICNITARIGGILAPFSKSLREISLYLVPALFGFSSLLAAILILILPETAGAKLADDIGEVDYGPVLGLCFKKPIHEKNAQRQKLLQDNNSPI